jgi:hypothetical protein
MTLVSLSLASAQQHFADALLDLDAVPQASALFDYEESLSETRLALYRGNLVAIWRGALANAYPVLLQLVGEDYFAQMARAYGRAHPSQEGDLNAFGAHLSEFLLSSGAADDYPYFVDVARIEWALHRAYYAKDADALSLMALAQATQQAEVELMDAHLECAPAVSLIESTNAAVDIWLAHQSEERTWSSDVQRPSYALITRLDWTPELHALDEAAFRALSVLRDGANLGEAFESALQVDAAFDVAGNLQSWFALGVFSGFSFK